MVGLDDIHSQVLSGDQLESMSEAQLDQTIANVSVFYRVTPRHKLAIVKVNELMFFPLISRCTDVLMNGSSFF